MNFGEALTALKEGEMVSRSGWNGKGMFLFIRPEFYCDKHSFDAIKSVPDKVKKKIISSVGEHQYRFTAYISMFAADGSIVNGWLASQTDMVAEDWEIVN